MLKIRLKRNGRKKHPVYKIIVIDSRKRRDGRAIDEIGFYNTFSKIIEIDIKKTEQRIHQGAQMTSTVESLIKKAQTQT